MTKEQFQQRSTAVEQQATSSSGIAALFGAFVEAVPAGRQCTDTDCPSCAPRETTSNQMGGSSTWEPVSVVVIDYPDAVWTYEDLVAQ